jgi:alpha-N-arabinofuranosidase
VNVSGASIANGHATVLTAADLTAHNSFDRPDAVKPRDAAVDIRGGSLTHTFPPASVTRLRLGLA